MFIRIYEHIKSTISKKSLTKKLSRIVIHRFPYKIITYVYYPTSLFKEYIAKICKSDTICVLLFSCKIYNTLLKVKVSDGDDTLLEFNKLTRRYKFYNANILRALLKRRDIILTQEGIIIFKDNTKIVLDRVVCITYDIAISCLRFKCSNSTCEVFITLDRYVINFIIDLYIQMFSKGGV